jgi:hypothetical protein
VHRFDGNRCISLAIRLALIFSEICLVGHDIYLLMLRLIYSSTLWVRSASLWWQSLHLPANCLVLESETCLVGQDIYLQILHLIYSSTLWVWSASP